MVVGSLRSVSEQRVDRVHVDHLITQKSICAHDADAPAARKKSCKKKASRSAKGRALVRASPTNWFGVELWPAIDKVAKSCGFRTREMVKVLRSGVGGDVYQPLSAGSIERWIARDSQGSSLRRWKDLVLTKVANGGSRDIQVPHLGRPSAMVEFFFYFEKKWANIF